MMQKQSRLKLDHRCRECTPLLLARDSATQLTRTQAGSHGERATATQRTHPKSAQVSVVLSDRGLVTQLYLTVINLWVAYRWSFHNRNTTV